MGPDAMAVVDDRLRVHGLQGLRVIDASVMPTVTSTNTNAPTIMIAEKGAAFIKAAARERLAAWPAGTWRPGARLALIATLTSVYVAKPARKIY